MRTRSRTFLRTILRTSPRTTARLAALLCSAIPLALQAQGSLIPRPCGPAADCAIRPCAPDVPCPPQAWPSAIVRSSSHVRVELVDRVLRYEVDETFLNQGGRVGEADYVFPLPKNAAFQELTLSINGEQVAGETMNADRARGIYEEIVRRQRDPALVEWMGYGLLRARIFPVAPGEEKRVVVRFQVVAEREGDALRVDYHRGPVGAAAVRRDDDVDDVRPSGTRRVRQGEERDRESFTLTLPARGQLGEPYSPTHTLDVSDANGRRRVSARGAGRDVTVLLPLRTGSEPAITMLANAPGSEDGFALITLSPPSAATRTTPRDVTFVLDVSGSMSGKKMDQARAAGRALLASLRPEDRFRLIDFSTDVRTFRDDFLFATAKNIDEANAYLDGLRAEGSTNIAGALDAALHAPDGRARDGASRIPVVLFITDGEPTVGEQRPDALAALASRERGQARLFTFGLGADVNAVLIEQLALEGRGTAHFVRPAESVERAVSVVASRLRTPVVTSVRVRADGVRLFKMLPAGPVDVFAGQDLVLLARYSGNGRARLRFDGTTAAGPVSWTQDVDFPERERGNAFVPRLWATQRIGYLSAERRRAGASSETADEIRQLGERYGIPTEFNSYLVVEPGMVAGRPMEQRRQLNGVVIDNAVVGSAMPASAPAARDRAFDAAKTAQAQRSAVSLEAADAVSARRDEGAQSSGTRRVGDRVFNLKNGVWTDGRSSAGLTTIRVKAFSDAYFKVLELAPELRPVLALGDRVRVAGRKVAIEIAPDGAERLSDRDLATIRSAW